MGVNKKPNIEKTFNPPKAPEGKTSKILIIMNRQAGSGYRLSSFFRKLLKLQHQEALSIEEIHQRIKRAFESYRLWPEYSWTQYAGHANILAREAAKSGYETIVAVGGDGTINEVVNGIANTKTKLGIIPLGTANLLASEIGIPTNIEAACQIVAKGAEAIIDTVKVNNQHFTVMAGIGFDAHVVSKVNTALKSKWGALSYPLVALNELARYPFRRIKIKTQDGIELRAFYVFIQNARIYGSGFKLSPDSKMNDGVFEVLMFPTKNIFSFISYLISKEKHNYCVEMKGVKYLQINSSQAIQIDGDYAFKGPAEIKISPLSLRVLVSST